MIWLRPSGETLYPGRVGKRHQAPAAGSASSHRRLHQTSVGGEHHVSPDPSSVSETGNVRQLLVDQFLPQGDEQTSDGRTRTENLRPSHEAGAGIHRALHR